MIEDTYTENRTDTRYIVKWDTAVPGYALRMFWYAFVFGFAVWPFVWLLPEGGAPTMPESFAVWLWLLLTSILFGLAMGGFVAGMALFVKDIYYKTQYGKPVATVKNIPRTQLTGTLKEQPLSRHQGKNSKYGNVKLQPAQWVELATAVLKNGERLISQRKLSEWGVFGDRSGSDPKRFIEDLIRLEYAEPASNSQYTLNNDFIVYLSDMFPAM
jgi:hypothetical protein